MHEIEEDLIEKKLEDHDQKISELVRWRIQIETGKKVAIWVFSAIGATAIFMLTMFEKVKALMVS